MTDTSSAEDTTDGIKFYNADGSPLGDKPIFNPGLVPFDTVSTKEGVVYQVR